MKDNKLSNLIGLYLLIGLVAFGVLGYFVISKTITRANTHKAERLVVQTEIKALEQLEHDTEELRVNYQNIKDQRDEILSLLPPQTEEENLLALLSEIAQRSGVVLNNFSPESVVIVDVPTAEGELVGSHRVYPVTLNVIGTYETIFGDAGANSFLGSIENGARFIDVISTDIASSTTPGDESINVRLVVNAYYQAPATESETQ